MFQKSYFLIGMVFLFLNSGLGQPNFEYITDYSFSHIQTIHFANDDLGIIGEHDQFKITTDGGKTWWTRTIPDFNPAQLKISVQGTDTLIVAMEAKSRGLYVTPERNRALVFHGIRSQPQEIYNTDFIYALINTSLIIRDSSIYMSGIFADSSDIHPITGSYTPYIMVSHDHGNTWTNRKTPLSPSIYKSLYELTYYSKDTLIISWYDFQQFYSRAYANDLQILVPGNEISGKVLDSRNGVNIIESNNNELQILKGFDGSLVKNAVDNWCNLDGYTVKFIDDLEFLTDGFRLCDASFPFGSNMAVFSVDADQASSKVLVDTNLYDFRAGLPGPLFRGANHPISVTENYVYMLRAPYIIKFSRHQLSHPEVYSLDHNITVGYTSDFSSLVIGGLESNREYWLKFYTLGGTPASEPITINSNSNLCSLQDLSKGIYLIHISEKGKPTSLVYKILVH